MPKKYNELNDEVKAKIFVLLNDGKSQKQIAKILNISSHNVFLIKNRFDEKKYNRGNVIRATGVSDSLFNDLLAISDNLGYKKLSQFIKKELPSIRDKYPPNMRIKKD